MPCPINISFIIPVYNEEYNIVNVLKDLHSIIKLNPHWGSEIIVIEDGSSDNTLQILKQEIKKYPEAKLIIHERNKGYTTSLKDGIAYSSGKFLMYIGADEEFDCSEVPLFINPLLRGETDVVLGVRWQRNAYKLFRFFISVIYIFFLNYLFKLRVNDYNWSQAWPRKLFDQIILTSKSLFILPEIIIKAHDLNFRIKEVPSNHRGRHFGKSSLNMKIMGSALLESIQFWRKRNSKKTTPQPKSNLTQSVMSADKS